MRKKLALLVLALAALAAANATSPAAALTCPTGSHLVVCQPPHPDFCCPNNAFCICGPF